MNSSSDDRGRAPAIRIAGLGLGVLGAVGGIAGWFTLTGAAEVATSSLTQTGGTSVAGSAAAVQLAGTVHTRTGSS
jgi:hypothetical protein